MRRLTTPHDGDHLTFVIQDGVRTRGTGLIAQLSVTAYAGAEYDTFAIDLSTDLRPVTALDRISPSPVVDVPGLPAPPEITVYPLPDQIADKMCAMYETHGASGLPSTRYRDLVDLVLIVTTTEIDAGRTAAAIASERRRRGLDLPVAMVVPSTSWPAGYASEAGRTRLRGELHRIDVALAVVAECLDPILAGTRISGIWTPPTGWSIPS
ncbi:nucleotidyl transferase AbiEii/AbiGii toxin family protein [Jiangella endophytica]|uniref:nucleotidyl transferase AbiEii/AbiGii toxin family protein n=1 Tax=Jiangella endophytica TaxID=1623398 RepID=UPI000E34F96B|nr:nucleotidyl transferase AbiEii/AbiGii toxin family protein [Jiangella endophytica]